MNLCHASQEDQSEFICGKGHIFAGHISLQFYWAQKVVAFMIIFFGWRPGILESRKRL